MSAHAQHPNPYLAYMARRDRLLEALRAAGPRGTTTGALRAQLGWSTSETTAKLRSLRTDNLATYNPAREHWTATTQEQP